MGLKLSQDLFKKAWQMSQKASLQGILNFLSAK